MLVASTPNLIINSTSPLGEKIVVWMEDGKYKMFHFYPYSELDVVISQHNSSKELIESMSFHAWILQGIKSKQFEEEIKKVIQK
jgi:hypothetical protein